MDAAQVERLAVKPTAFVSHSDCSRHDTGWRHPEHQGRLPALVRAVYRDMLVLHDHLLEVEATPAGEPDLLLVHTPRLIDRIRTASRQASEAGAPTALAGQVMISGASWDAARAAVGTALTGVDTVLAGRARNAFCAARPPGYAAGADDVGGFSLFNSVAIAARHLQERHGLERIFLVEWGGTARGATAQILAHDSAVRLFTVREQGELTTQLGAETVTLPPRSDGELLTAAFEAGLAHVLPDFRPQFILLAAGFDILEGDPVGRLHVRPPDIHRLTSILRDWADVLCDGRLVSVLEGGYNGPALGQAVVQHLRALAGLPPV